MKLSLAPLRGITIAHYRNEYNRIFGGIDTYYAPFIATTNKHKLSQNLFKDILPQNTSKETHLIPQLLGNNGPNFRHFASTITDMGYNEINWNIGCPFPMVTNKKKGSGILAYPDIMNAFLDDVCNQQSYRFSIKMRVGLSDIEEGLEAIKICNQYPIDEIIIHPRTGKQLYKGHVDLDAFEALYKESVHDIAYNGDIFTIDDYRLISQRFPDITHFMLARGAVSDPFLASEIKGVIVPPSEKLKKIQELHDSMFTYYKAELSGDKHLLDKMKGFWTYISSNIDGIDQYTKKIKKSQTPSMYSSVVNHLFMNTKWI